MALKKNAFQTYVKKTDDGRQIRAEAVKRSKYTHHRVYDNLLDEQENLIQEKIEKKPKQPKIKYENHKHIENISEHNDILIESPNNIILDSEYEIKKKILNLDGMQKKIFFGLINLAYNNNATMVSKLTAEKLTILSESSYGSAKMSLMRLIKKGLVMRYKGKTSANGYCNLGFNTKVYELAMEFTPNIKIKQSVSEEILDIA